MDTVDGIALRLSWSTLEPTDNVYDWSVLDSALSLAAARGKKVTLHVLASVYAPPPGWVYTQGAASYTYTAFNGATHTDPVPWDSVFLSKWSEFLNALAQHISALNATSTLESISVAAPVPEMSLVSCANGMLTSTLAYNRTSYLNAWKTTVQATHTAFPTVTKLLPAPVAQICRPDGDGPAFYREVYDYAAGLSSSFAFYSTDLNALGSARLNGASTLLTQAPVGLQFIWSASNDPQNRMQGTLKDAVCSGLRTYSGDYFEVYKVDLQSTQPTIQDAIRAIRTPSLCG
jgi:hypothetical protein